MRSTSQTVGVKMVNDAGMHEGRIGVFTGDVDPTIEKVQ